MTEPRNALVEGLFARHRTALQAFFFRRLRTKADAADLAQDVYLRILRVNEGGPATRKPISWAID